MGSLSHTTYKMNIRRAVSGAGEIAQCIAGPEFSPQHGRNQSKSNNNKNRGGWREGRCCKSVMKS